MSQDQLSFKKMAGNIENYYGIALYFKCKGIFADPFVGDHLPIDGSPARTGNKVIDDYWGSDELEYEHFFNEVTNIFERFYPTCKSWNEYQLEEKFIKPILTALGYEYDVQETVTHAGKRSRPDYTLFFDSKSIDQALKAKERDEAKYWAKAISVADAKAWSVDLDSDGGPQNCPSSQIVRYLDATVKDWGIITNGRQWRLYYRNCQDRSLKYFEIDLERICLSKNKHERMQYFFYFFRNKALNRPKEKEASFLDSVLKESEAYAVQVSNNLKEKIIRQAPRLTEALMRDKGVSLELDEAYKYSLYYCFRLIFVLAAESRGVLDIALDSKYHKLSLRKIAFELREKWSEGHDWTESSTETYSRLKELFSLLDQGNMGFGLVGFRTNAYDACDRKVFNKISLSDLVMNDLVLDLACDIDESNKRLFVDYKRISPEHLGGIFESLLEFRPHLTAGKKVLLEGATDRKDSGSYYTPDYVVDYLLSRVIPEDANFEKMKVLDPACGSGHFVVGAIRALSTRAAANEDENLSLEDVRSRVAERCVYGIDRNEVAVALTKLSIYLTSMQKDKPLPKIDENIRHADSLREKSFRDFEGGFDLVVGNPPYVNTKLLSKSDPELKQYLVESGDYSICKGCFDLYIPFIERGIKTFVKKGGTLGFVLPNKLMVADYAEEARRFAESRCERIEVIDISHLEVFKGVGVYPHLFLFKTKSKESPSVQFTLESAEATVVDESFAWFETKVINDELRTPSGNVWSAQKKNRKGLTTLSSVCEIEGGVTGYQAQEVLKALTDGNKKSSKGLVRFIVSGNILKGKIQFGKVRYMKHDFSDPYLNLTSKVITKGKRELFECPKVVIAGMTKEIRAVYAKEPLAVGVGVFSVTESQIPMEAVSAILNSLAFTFLYREKFEAKHLAGGYLAINASQLKDADFPEDISPADVKELTSWSKKLASKNFSTKERIEYEKFVANLFGLAPKEIGKLEVFDSESAEVIEAFRKGKAA